MRLAVITPVGPGHEVYVHDAIASVDDAIQYGLGRFSRVTHHVVDDTKGIMGRGRARNSAMTAEVEWFFFLDADDKMMPSALTLNDFSSPATFGAVRCRGMRLFASKRINVYPCSWRTIARVGCRGTLSMGFFVRAEVARAIRFDEDMVLGEDYDFYMKLPAFTKVASPLVEIGYDLPSAGGPRGYDDADWTSACDEVISRAVARDPEKFNISGDAVLAQAARTPRQRRELFKIV